MTKYFIGAVGALIGVLAGAWLMLAPFALAYQPSGADWADPTYTDFWTGLPLLIVSLVGLVVYAAGLVGEMRERGIIERREFPEPQAADAPQNGSVPDGAQQTQTDQVLLPLVTAMLKDMQEQQRRREEADSRETRDAPRNNQEEYGSGVRQ
ncbi:MAG: hypothetical protein H0X71_10295 [Rubrobacter sp.]|nr:hypothetical protein [Rubrobacter sp.]